MLDIKEIPTAVIPDKIRNIAANTATQLGPWADNGDLKLRIIMNEAEEDERNTNDMIQARTLNSDIGKSLSEEFININHIKQKIDDLIKNGLKLG